MSQSSTYYGDGPVPLDDFPSARNAVELCEHLTQWDMYRATVEAEGFVSLKERLRGSATEAMNKAKAENDHGRAEVLRVALAEWDEPEFIIYLTRKLW